MCVWGGGAAAVVFSAAGSLPGRVCVCNAEPGCQVHTPFYFIIFTPPSLPDKREKREGKGGAAEARSSWKGKFCQQGGSTPRGGRVERGGGVIKWPGIRVSGGALVNVVVWSLPPFLLPAWGKGRASACLTCLCAREAARE